MVSSGLVSVLFLFPFPSGLFFISFRFGSVRFDSGPLNSVPFGPVHAA